MPTGGKLGVVFVHDAGVKSRGTACFLMCANGCSAILGFALCVMALMRPL